MFFPIPNPFATKERRVKKAVSTESLDRPLHKIKFAEIFKQDEAKFVVSTTPVHPHSANAYAIRTRGIG
jgi:hypothetical protein